MKIAHLCAYTWEIGGPAKVIYDHAAVAVTEGHAVDILSPFTEGETPYPTPAGANLHLFARTNPLSRFFREFSWPLFGWLRKNIGQYDVVHCHGLWHWASLAPFLVHSPNVVKVVTVHGVLDPWVYAKSRLKKRLMDVLAQHHFLQRANLIHVITEEERTHVQQYLGQPHPNIVCIPNGIHLADFAQLPPKGTFRQAFDIPEEKKLVLFMSRLNVKKGLDLLLPAFRDYVRKDAGAVLVLAGPDDGYAHTARDFIQENGLDNHIRMVGMLTGERKLAALADADLFTLPSYSEGFSMVCLEAMAARTPALLSDRVGFAEAIRAYDAAELIELTPEGVLNGLRSLLANPARRETIGQNGQRLVREQYSIDKLSRQLLHQYQAARSRLLSQRPPGISSQ
jgi:glycosyltransferase involved in cell wall biosynthesis